MIIKLKSASRSLLILILSLGVLTPLSPRHYPIQTTTLALLYDEQASVLACDLQDPIVSEIPEIHQLTMQVSNQDVQDKIETYSQCAGITIYEVPQSHMSLIPIDPAYTSGYQWNLTGIDMTSAWDITTGSEDVIVAVIDTGVNSTSPLTDFGSDGLVLGASIINGVTRVDTFTSQYSYDGGSHGTAVASLISANMNSTGLTGIAPGVKIMPIKVFRDAAYANELVSALSTDIAAAIIYATNHGADIINLSLGGPSDASTQSAVEYAYGQGVILVAASGNDSNNSAGVYYNVSYPAAYPQVIAVGSLSQSTTVSNFSNVAGEGLDLSAYGERIYLPWLVNNNYALLSGTSFSAPTVAGVLALMKSVYPDLSPKEAEAILLSGVTDLIGTDYDPGWDVWSGYGMVNALQALLEAADYDTYSDGNLDAASAQFIYGHHAYASQLRPAMYTDFFEVTLYEPDDVTITLSTGSIHDLMFEVLDTSLTRIILVDDGSSGETETVTLNDLVAGTYYIQVTDYASRAYLSDYSIEVDYASTTLPLISAMTEEGALTTGQSTVFPVTISIIESLYHTISVTLEGTSIDVPKDLIFTEVGDYVVTVDDVLNDPVSFSFSILRAQGVEDNGIYNSDRVLVFAGTATLNDVSIPSGTTVSIEGSYTLVITNEALITTIHFILDKTAPQITIDPYSTDPTYLDVVVSASVNEGDLNAASHTFTENGSFTFTATDLAGNTSSTTITITHIHKVTSVELDKEEIYLYALGSTTALSVTVNPLDAVEKSVTWSSSDPLIVSVDQDGIVTAVSVGSATITVTSIDGSFTASALVTVILSRHLEFTLSGLGGTLQVKSGETVLTSDSDVAAGTELVITVSPLDRYRIYRWTINETVLDNVNVSQTLTIGPSDLSIEVELGLIGDLNLTDEVSTTDLVQLRRYLAGLDALESKGVFNADLNGDGQVTTTDLVQLRRFLAGLE